MGCGRTGSALASRLEGGGDEVCVVDPDEGARHRLSEGFRGRFVTGNGITPGVLEAAGIADAEAFVAMTANDGANIVAARSAQQTYRVPRVLARLYDPAKAQVYSELGIPVIGMVQTTVNRAVQLLRHITLEPHQIFGNGETLLVRAPIPAYLAGRRAAEFAVPGEIAVVELTRSGHSRIPEATAVLQAGDVLSFIVAAGSLGRLKSFLDGRWS